MLIEYDFDKFCLGFVYTWDCMKTFQDVHRMNSFNFQILTLYKISI